MEPYGEWGLNTSGQLGQGDIALANFSSPKQVYSGTEWSLIGGNPYTPVAIIKDTTP